MNDSNTYGTKSQLVSAETNKAKQNKPIIMLEYGTGGKVSPSALYGSPFSMRVTQKAYSPEDHNDRAAIKGQIREFNTPSDE